MLSGCEERYEKIRVLVNKANSVVQGAIRIQEKNIIIKELKDDKTKLETELEDVEKKKARKNLEDVKAKFAVKISWITCKLALRNMT